jgi:hypothetical protein
MAYSSIELAGNGKDISMIDLLQQSLAKLPPKSRGRQIVIDLIKQERTKQMRDELPFIVLDRDIAAAVKAELRAL